MKYLQGGMSDTERADFEVRLQSDPLLADALEGMQQIPDTALVSATVSRLRRRASERVMQEQARSRTSKPRITPDAKTIWMYSGSAVAAVVIFLLAVFLFRAWDDPFQDTPESSPVADNIQPSMAPPLSATSPSSEDKSIQLQPLAENQANTAPEEKNVSAKKEETRLSPASPSGPSQLEQATQMDMYSEADDTPKDKQAAPEMVERKQAEPTRATPASKTSTGTSTIGSPVAAAPVKAVTAEKTGNYTDSLPGIVFMDNALGMPEAGAAKPVMSRAEQIANEDLSLTANTSIAAFDRVLANTPDDIPAVQAFQSLKNGNARDALSDLPIVTSSEAQQLAKGWSLLELGQLTEAATSFKPLLNSKNLVYKYEAEWLCYEALDNSGDAQGAANLLKIIAKGNGPYQKMAQSRL